jgi:hypothetical protein
MTARTDDQLVAERIGNQMICRDTGEVFDLDPSQIETYIARGREAEDQEKAWHRQGAFYKHLSEALLTRMGIQKVTTDAGTASIVSFTRSDGNPEALPEVIAEYGLDVYHLADLLGCVHGLSATKLAALEWEGPARGAIADLIRETEIRYVKLAATRKYAPRTAVPS